jgi:hypothetical protein
VGVFPTEWGVSSAKNMKERFERYEYTVDLFIDNY